MRNNDLIVGLGGAGDTYLEALQNRNKTQLLETLGVAPPIPVMEEPQEKDTPNLTKIAINKGIALLKKATGLEGFMSNLQSIASRPMEMAWNRYWSELEHKFMPMRMSLRAIQQEIERTIRNNPMSASIVGIYGQVLGYMIGGPIGGAIGQVVGAVGGAYAYDLLTQLYEEWEKAKTKRGPIWDPATGELIEEAPDYGRRGAPSYPNLSPNVMRRHQTRMRTLIRNTRINKVRDITESLY